MVNYISKSNVEKSILKYFNIKFDNHRSMQDSKFNGNFGQFNKSQYDIKDLIELAIVLYI